MENWTPCCGVPQAPVSLTGDDPEISLSNDLEISSSYDPFQGERVNGDSSVEQRQAIYSEFVCPSLSPEENPCDVVPSPSQEKVPRPFSHHSCPP